MYVMSQNGSMIVELRKVYIKKQGDKYRIIGHGCLGTYSTFENASYVLKDLVRCIGMQYPKYIMLSDDEVTDHIYNKETK